MNKDKFIPRTGKYKIIMAPKDAKLTFYNEEWGTFTSRPFARVCILETAPYGDPAAPYGAPGQSG